MKISDLGDLERGLHRRRSRFWAHHYLAEVFDVASRLSTEELSELCQRDCGDELDAARRLMKLTSAANGKTISRWVQALAYVSDVIDDRGGTVEAVLRELGGISGCARAIATPKRAPDEKRRDWK